MNKTALVLTIRLSVLVLVSLAPAWAQWQPDGVGVSVYPYNKAFHPVLTSDGSGGAIVAWFDWNDWSIEVQRVNASGVPQWTVNGVALVNSVPGLTGFGIVSDGAGGAIVAWEDSRQGIESMDIYAQRVNASGVPLWTANGVGICTAAGRQCDPSLVSDGAGGAIIAWEDGRVPHFDIYVQRVNASGIPQWTANGSAVSTVANAQARTSIDADGTGGAIIAWEDERALPGDRDIYAQRVDASGAPQWAADGAPICTVLDDQASAQVLADGAGGAILAWVDSRNTSQNTDIYAQRVNSSGVRQWPLLGAPICVAGDNQQDVKLASDGALGAFVTWADARTGNRDIYAQRIDPSGASQWLANGVLVSSVVGDQHFPVITADGSGNAIIAWSTASAGISAQRIVASGGASWTIGGVPVCTFRGYRPQVIPDGAGSAIIAWYDGRNGCVDVEDCNDIYAQRIEFQYGYWGGPEPVLNSIVDTPLDQGMMVDVEWSGSQHDVAGGGIISHYSIWRSTDLSGSSWEMVGEQPATGQSEYSFAAPTLFNSGPGGPVHHFRVDSHAPSLGYEWLSNVIDGYSVDNLAPEAPYSLAAERQADGVHLTWNHDMVPDLNDYAIYRSLTPGKSPGPSQFFMSSTGTTALDAGAPGGALYYCVTARDANGNESAPSNEAGVDVGTGAGDSPALTALTIRQNRPNPFHATTDFEVGLPAASPVTIEVFDVTGKNVSTMAIAGAKGWQRIPFAGRDERGRPLASGVYFARVSAAGATVTSKMVIAR